MTVGRIGSFLKPDRGMAAVRVVCKTAAGARSPELIRFADLVAAYAYGYGLDGAEWEELVEEVGFTINEITLEDERKGVAFALKEDVKVMDIVVVRL